MTGLPDGFGLGDLSVRPVRGPDENARWRELMDELHYLGLRSAFGSTLKQVAVLPDGGWAALVGWTCGAFKTGARDRWIGWERERQFRRLHLIANNNRFLVLPGYAVPNPGVAGAGPVGAPAVRGHAGAARQAPAPRHRGPDRGRQLPPAGTCRPDPGACPRQRPHHAATATKAARQTSEKPGG